MPPPTLPTRERPHWGLRAPRAPQATNRIALDGGIVPSAHPPLTDEEYVKLQAIRQRGGRGSGWRVLAGELNRMRTADVYSPEVVWERSVSHEWVRAAYALATFKRQDPPTVKTLNELRR